MAKQRSKGKAAAPLVADQRKVRIFSTPLFRETLDRYKNNALVLKSLRDFIQAKRQDPLAAFGGKDYPFKGGDLKGYNHAGLTFDVNIVYTIEGKDPNIIKLRGIYSHDELGTGNPPRPNRQRQAAKSFSQQHQFAPLEPVDESTKTESLPLLIDLLDA